jgi:hypothetical protein
MWRPERWNKTGPEAEQKVALFGDVASGATIRTKQL